MTAVQAVPVKIMHVISFLENARDFHKMITSMVLKFDVKFLPFITVLGSEDGKRAVKASGLFAGTSPWDMSGFC